MTEPSSGREQRPIRIHTPNGAIEGCLQISPRLRTLDDLNLVSKRFVTVHTPKSLSTDWHVDPGPLAVNKSSILFVRELSPPPPTKGASHGNFTRAALRLRVLHFEVEGFVHVPPGGVPLKRLDQDNHPFVSLTSVLISGPDEHLTAPFLAVNRSFVTSAQIIEANEDTALAPPAHVEIER